MQSDLHIIDHIVRQMEEEVDTDREAAMADMRYTFIEELVAQCVTKRNETREQIRSQKLDRWLTHKYLGIPIFLCIMLFIFYLTFVPIGGTLQSLLESLIDQGIAWLDQFLSASEVSPWLHDLLIEGVCAGVGSVLSFLPLIVILFFFLSLLEDSGYMARVAYIMDKALRKIGLSGQKLCTDAHRLRLQRTGHHGITDAEQRPGQKDDDHFDTFYVLQCEAADLRNDNSGLFHSLFSPCHDVGLSAGNCRGNSVRTDHEKNNVQRKSNPLCHGTAGISHSFFAERFAAYVGKGKGFSA